MVQFKSVFLGEEERACPRATTAQKCLRAGGKHNDLENVGRTARHHTFFEMLGNFSFGDYFKEEAIGLAWEYLTDTLKLPKERLIITIFNDDDEAGRIWSEKIGLPAEKIVRCGEEDNFWSMGDTGPCGPCSEIHYDQGPNVGCKRPECNVECDCDRFLEIWNLVFMQFNRDSDGNMSPLPHPSIDTGMGLERLAAVVQGKESNYDTDLFAGIFSHIEKASGKKYGDGNDADVSMRVIADHIRAVTFLIADGVLPSNEGRGYVLRRIMRRAARHGRRLGLTEPFLHLLAGTVADEMGQAYPELLESRDFCAKVILNEEERFLNTLDHGMRLLDEEVGKLKKENKNVLPGDIAFRLYDTYGFPLDLTEDILKEEDMTVDKPGFDS
jgi:alanyl-tRNA synthetase